MSKRHSDETSGTEDSNGETLPEPKKKELMFGVKKPKLAFSIGKKPTPDSQTLAAKGLKVKESLKAAFNSDSEEEEEMPKEARMKMRNIGRDTPTSAGPKSFGKTKHGFCDSKRVFEKNLKDAADNEDDEDD